MLPRNRDEAAADEAEERGAARGAWESVIPPAPQGSTAARWMPPPAAVIGAAAVIAAAVVSVLVARRDLDASASRSAVRLAAQQIRQRALQACNELEWRECLQGLNAARSLDPSAEADERVREARTAAQSSLGQEPPSTR